MIFHVLTLFPDMIERTARTSILGRAIDSGAITLDVTNIRDFSIHGTCRVDDYPYGGGAGMVFEPEPISRAIRSVKEKAGPGTRVIYLTPAAKVLNQTLVEELAREDELILLCGHYEGIDERVLEEEVTDNISIGDYVLTGGELGACVLIDAVSRFVPGVLHNEDSSRVESFQDNLLEYPQYTRPEEWHGRRVPEVLLSGDHGKIEQWRHEQSLQRTKERRPDLLENSYRVSVLHFGSEEMPHTAERLAGAFSCYPEYLDYNRNKLKKHKRSFGASDLVFVVTDEPERIPEVLEKTGGHGSPLVLVSPQNAEAEEKLSVFAEEKGFSILARYLPEEDEGDVSLDLRKRLEGRKKTRG